MSAADIMTPVGAATLEKPNTDKAVQAIPKSASDWTVGLCQCCLYTSPETGKCVAVPLLCPQACCCPALILGANTSLLHQEKPIYIGEEEPDNDCSNCVGAETYWKLGDEGNKACLNTCLLQSLCYVLCGGLPAVSFLVHRQRKEIMLKYNMPPVSRCAALAAACLYPCTLFQHHAHLEAQHYMHHAPVFRTGASGTGINPVGPLRRGTSSKAFRGSASAASSQHVAASAQAAPDTPDMKRGSAGHRPSALQIPDDDFLSGGDGFTQPPSTSQPPSAHDSLHTIPAYPPATPSPASNPSGHHRQQNRSSSTSNSSGTAHPADIPSQPYSGWPLDAPTSNPTSRPSSIELPTRSHPPSPASHPDTPYTAPSWRLDGDALTAAMRPPASSSSARNAPPRSKPWHSRAPPDDLPFHSHPSPSASASSAPPYLTNPFAASPAPSPSGHVPPSPWSPSPSSSSAAATQALPWRPTRPAPPPPPAVGLSADSDMVLLGGSMGSSSMQQSLARLSAERRLPPMHPPQDTYKKYQPDPMDLSSLAAMSPAASPRVGQASPAGPPPAAPEVAASATWLPDSILRPPASSASASSRRNKRYENMMASIADNDR